VRREQLIRAAIESIAKRGLSDTTMAHVTEGANLSLGTVNFHFTTKQRLFEETLKFLVDEHRSRWRCNIARSSANPQDQLQALVDADFHPSICSKKKLSVWFAFYGEARYRSAYRDVCTQIDNERLKEIERLSRLLVEEGDYGNVDPAGFARTLEAFIDGLWLNMLLYGEKFSRAEARLECLSFLASTFPHHFETPEEMPMRKSV
jgi:TetR/AcrR family transcriptional repressor of bet genes